MCAECYIDALPTVNPARPTRVQRDRLAIPSLAQLYGRALNHRPRSSECSSCTRRWESPLWRFSSETMFGGSSMNAPYDLPTMPRWKTSLALAKRLSIKAVSSGFASRGRRKVALPNPTSPIRQVSFSRFFPPPCLTPVWRPVHNPRVGGSS